MFRFINFSFFLLVLVIYPKFVFSKNDSSVLDCAADTLLLQDSSRQAYVIVNSIQLIGNKVTKDHILLRELPFMVNDTILKIELHGKLTSAQQNLLNTSLFNFVTIDTFPSGNKHIIVLITVAERWYTWPSPIFEIQERNFNTWWQTRNFNRVNYGFFLSRENFRGRKEELSFYAQFGYTEKYGLTYTIPYINRKQAGGLGFSFSFSRNHEVGYQTYNNKLVYFKDPDKYVREELSGKLSYTYRQGIHITHSIDLKYNKAKIADTLNDYTIDYFIGNEIEIQYFTLNYYFKNDHRDSKMYPLNGYFFDFEATRMGFGILPNEKLDVTNVT
jgi:outer membrane protein assembly factor BamA